MAKNNDKKQLCWKKQWESEEGPRSLRSPAIQIMEFKLNLPKLPANTEHVEICKQGSDMANTVM